MSDKVKTNCMDAQRAPVREKLLDKAKSLPQKPGCYLMKNRDDQVLYVGKAKSLKSRVSSYFQNGQKTPKTEILVSHIEDFDFILTQTESEAFVLENNLIKKHAPKYNIMMRDDKSYPYVVIDHKEPFPRLMYQRKIKRDGHKNIFGPFVHGSNISEVLRILVKSFQLRDCSLREFNSRKEACLLYQIKQCSAPCVEKITKDDYENDLRLAQDFFQGRGNLSIKVLEERMNLAAEKEEFEHAAIIRDNVEILKNFLSFAKQENAEIHQGHKNFDIAAFHAGDIEVDISIYIVRNGILLGHKNFHFPQADRVEDIETETANFLFQYYSSSYDILPEMIVLPFDIENLDIFTKAMKTLGKVKVKSPGKKLASLMKLTKDHALEHQRVRITNQESVYVGLNKLQDLLSLKERPILLECYDVAIFQGTSPAASQIVYREGTPEKKRYRYYHLEERPEGNNDFAMMKEVLSRRLKYGDLPDVFIVDGGKGQVSIFQSVLKDFELNIPVVGIAKSKGKEGKNGFKKSEVTKSEERLIIPGRVNPYFLSKNKSLFKIITQMRDEAHRFSRKLHHKAEKKRTLTSWLDQVEGIGPKTREKILTQLELSKDELKMMKAQDIAKSLNVSLKISKSILKTLKESS